MFGTNWMERLFFMGMIGVVVTVVAYLSLRMFVWSKAAAKSLEYIRRHALWTGFIAWAFSSLAGANRAGIYDPHMYYPTHWHAIPWLAIFAPVVAVVSVHAIGQATWPAPKATKRVAVLEFRRMRDYIPTGLGWTTLGVFLFSAAVMPFVATTPGVAAITIPVPGAVSPYMAGRMSGGPLALALTLALLLLAAGTLLVMRLITSRRSLEALTPEQNKTLRIIGVNRLLRVSATVASGLATIAGNYLVQPMPGSLTLSYTNWLALANIAVLVAMLLWKPPFLDSPTDDAGYNILHVPGTSAPSNVGDGPAAAKLTNSASAAVLPAAIVGAAVGYAINGWFGLTGIVAAATVSVLMAHLALEIVLRRNYATPGAPHARLGVLLPRPMYFAFAVAIVGMVLALIGAHGVAVSNGPNTWDGIDTPAALYLVPVIAALAILTLGLATMRFVLVRPRLNNVSASLDRTLRRRSLFRIARTITGSWYAILGILLVMVPVAPDANPLMPQFESSVFGVLCIVIAVLIACYPMRAFTPHDFMPTAAHDHSVSR